MSAPVRKDKAKGRGRARELDGLKEAVCRANLDLVARGLVVETWGNASAVDRASGVLVIKPSGVSYTAMDPDSMVVVDLETGEALSGSLRPSSDTPTHRELYRCFPRIGGVVHTHSLYATAWAQAQRSIPPLGTTHADYWRGEIPCTRPLKSLELGAEYEVDTGRVIVERFRNVDPMDVPAVLVSGHGPFTWGVTVDQAVENAAVLEFVAKLASETERLKPGGEPISQLLLDRHFLRKHGNTAYYGQGSPAAADGKKILSRRSHT